MTPPSSPSDLVVVLHPAQQVGMRAAFASLPGIELRSPPTAADVLAALRGAEALVTARTGWRDTYLDSGIRWVQSGSAGYEGFPLDELARRGIVLTTAQGLHPVVAEHAVGLLVAVLRDFQHAVRDMPGSRWNPHLADELAGQTVVILGLGAIGEGIARRLAAWDVRIIGVTRTPRSYAGGIADVRPLTELRAACTEASVLMVALPSLPETRHVVSGEVLDALGPGWVVNVARGALIDEEAMIERLRDGRLRGAGLDVVTVEPLPESSPLRTLPNVLLTPHMGGHSPRYPARLAEIFAHNLRAYRGLAEWRNRIR